jgi:hypothetical protein
VEHRQQRPRSTEPTATPLTAQEPASA